MTFLWFIVWFIADHLGDRAPLQFDPANVWGVTLLLAIALDLGSLHASGPARRRRGN
jgi:hypothetical protein